MSEEQNTALVPVLPPRVITNEEKKVALQSAVHHLTNAVEFYGRLISELVMRYTDQLPTAAITFNVKLGQYEIYLNPQFFCNLTSKERVAVLHHEVLHFTNKHLFRLPFLANETKEEDRKLYNIAGDMAINQYIVDLPVGTVDVKQWKLDDGSAFPLFKSMEMYYELIKKENEKQKGKNDKAEKGEGKPSKGNVPEQLDKFKSFDQHMWDSLDEETKEKMLAEAKKVLKRTIEKTSTAHSNIPDGIKDLIQDIETMSSSLNYKSILRNVIKRTVSSVDREHTWQKPNKRYGIYSPGSKMGAMPALEMFFDTSGSMSHTEININLKIMSEFLKAGVRNCKVGLWHTSLYYLKKYKLNGTIEKESWQSGGTDIAPCLEYIKKAKPNLSVIFTDGYYDKVDIKLNSEVLFIISKGGNVNHPLKHLGKTIPLEHLK